MIKKTFSTLKQSPSVFLATAIPFVLMALAMIPVILTFGSFFNEIIMTEGDMNSMPQEQMVTLMSGYMLSIGLIFVIEMAAIFLAVPVVMNRIYELCKGVNEPGWIKRGLERSWWKPFVTGIILYACIFVVAILAILLMFIPILGFIVYALFVFAFYAWAFIAFTSVIAEDDFGTGLGRIFLVGGRYFFKMAGVILLTIVPVILLSCVPIAFFINDMVIISNSDAINTVQVFTKMYSLIWIISGIAGAYYIFALPFAYTYSMHQYLANRGLIFPDDSSVTDQNEETAPQQEVNY